MINTPSILKCVKFKARMLKVTTVINARGMMGQKGQKIRLCLNLSLYNNANSFFTQCNVRTITSVKSHVKIEYTQLTQFFMFSPWPFLANSCF